MATLIADKLANLKRITFAQAEALAAEQGEKLIGKSESKTFFRRGGRSQTITRSWYELSSSDEKFSCLTDVRDYLMV